MQDLPTDEHHITPAKDSARQADGTPADLTNPRHYPVTGTCLECGRAIWCKAYFFAEWMHLDTGEDAPMENAAQPPVSGPGPAPAGCPVPLGPLGPHPATYLSPERARQWYQEVERLAALEGLPPLPIPGD